jgi:Tetratricopeptide repeat
VRHQEGSLLAVTGVDPVPSFEDGVQAADRSANPMARVLLRADLGTALARRDPGRAAGLISEAEGVAIALTEPLPCANALATTGHGWWALGRADDGVRCWDHALGLLREARAVPMLVRLAVTLTDLCTVAGRPDDARRYLGAALAAGEQVGGPGGAANAMVMLGQAALQRGDQAGAQQAFRDAVGRLQAARLPVPPQLAAALGNPGW